MIGLLPMSILLFIILSKHKTKLVRLSTETEDDFEKEIYSKRIRTTKIWIIISIILIIAFSTLVIIPLFLWLLGYPE
jgi:hypothetical protein